MEAIQACLYSFQGGVKAYLIFTVAKKTESLTAGLFNGITKAIRGDDGDRITGQLNENIDAIRKNIPSILVARIEAPGKPVQEPDKEAVAAIIPPKVETVAAAQPVASDSAQVQSMQVANYQPSATPMAAKIEARKNLTAMGLTYHSQEQFIAAIGRNDDVAVQLFLDAGGIDVTKKDKSGKAAVDIAKEKGYGNIVKLLETPASPSPTTVPPTPAPIAAQAIPDARAQALQEAMTTLPPELIRDINQQVDTMNLAPEQKQAAREQALINASNALKSIQGLMQR